MATVIRQIRKKGINYRIQVPVKDEKTGKYKTATTTWEPPKGLTKRDQDKAAEAFALEYEKHVKANLHNPFNIDENATLKEYSVIFLDYMEKHTSANYHSSCQTHTTLILSILGNYKLNELKPLVTQNFIDNLSSLTYVQTTVTPKAMIRKKIKDRKLSLCKFAMLAGISDATLKSAVSGKNVALESAEKIANALQSSADELFTIINETRHYSSETLAKIVRIFKHMLSLAKRFEILDKNYASAEYVKGIQGIPKEKEIMDLDDTLDTLECIEKEKDLRAVTAVMIGIYMGRRRGEVAGLQWSDLDLENGIMDVKRSRTSVARKGVIEKTPKSEHSAKSYSMPSSLTNQLKKYKAWWNDYVENILGDRYQGLPYLFLQLSGKPVHPSTIYGWWKKLQKKYNLKDVDFHSLRTTNISIQYASNLISSEMIADRAGHANDKVTKQKYRKVFQNDDKRAAEIVDEIFSREHVVTR
ncbi:MAG TPA: site-specific integrase [Clostridia bacterium]